MLLRELRASDVEQLVSIAAESGLSYWPPDGFISHFADTSALSKGIIAESGLAGFIVARLIPGETEALDAELLNIGVYPKFQGRGYGGLLMSAFVDFCTLSKARKAWLEVRDSNQRARSLYSRFGFQEIGRRRGFYTDPTEDAVLMCLTFDHDED